MGACGNLRGCDGFSGCGCCLGVGRERLFRIVRYPHLKTLAISPLGDCLLDINNAEGLRRTLKTKKKKKRFVSAQIFTQTVGELGH